MIENDLKIEIGNDWIDNLEVKDKQHAIRDVEYVIIENNAHTDNS